MPRELQLGKMIENVRSELGMALEPNLGIDLERTIILRLQSAQEELWMDNDWPHLQVYRYKAVRAGERFYDFPSDLDQDRIYNAEFKFNNIYIGLTFGINRTSFVFRDSDRDQRQDPVRQWDFHRDQTNQTTQFEVWPIPATNGNLYQPISDPPAEETFDPDRNVDGDRFIRFEGIQNLLPLEDKNSDYSTLDGRLLVLTVAAIMAPKYAKEDADRIARRADAYFNKLKGRSKKTEPFPMGTDIDQKQIGNNSRRRTINSYRYKYSYATKNP